MTPDEFWADKPRKSWVVPVYAYDSVRDLPRQDAHGCRIGFGSPADTHTYYIRAATREGAARAALEIAPAHCLRGHRHYHAWGTRLMTPADLR